MLKIITILIALYFVAHILWYLWGWYTREHKAEERQQDPYGQGESK